MLLRKTSASHLRDSLYGFKTYEGSSWLLEYDVHHTPVDPDMAAVNTIKHNAAQLKVKHLEMHRAIQMCCFRTACIIQSCCPRTAWYNSVVLL